MFNLNSLIVLGLLILLLCLGCNSATCTQLFIALALAATFSDCFCAGRNGRAAGTTTTAV